MTRPAQLVLDGNTIKVRLQADRDASGVPVHVDWLRFTLPRRAAPVPSVDLLFPSHDSVWHQETREGRLAALIATMPDCEVAGAEGMSFKPDERGAALEAFELGQRVCAALGPEFSLAVEVRKGHDFYKFRWSIMRAEAECGWVGFLSSSSSPRQQAQGRTLHVNLYGVACTFGRFGWREAVADLIDECHGDITRCDLALDFFDGLPGGFDSVRADYEAGLCNVNGKEPKCNMLGDWVHGHARSFYFGSKEAGKQTNVYEKGDQLFGVDAGSLWHRVELRYGNKLRVLPTDMLRRPADFFAGASDWHALVLSRASAIVDRSPVKCKQRLQAQTVEAEVSRSLRWAASTAAATFVTWMLHAPETFVDHVMTTKRPGRLQRFNTDELKAAMSAVLNPFHCAGGPGPSAVCA